MSDPSDIRETTVSSTPDKKTVSVSFNGQRVIKVLAVILLVVVAFWLGILYGDHHTKDSLATGSSSTTTGGGNGFSRGGGGLGTVSAVSSTSITVASQRSGTSNTYAITSSTKITDAGQSATVSSIATGDRVIVTPSSSNSSDASQILVNPSFGGFGGGDSSTSGSSTSNGSSTSGSATIQ
jgi:hypothetical protein